MQQGAPLRGMRQPFGMRLSDQLLKVRIDGGGEFDGLAEANDRERQQNLLHQCNPKNATTGVRRRLLLVKSYAEL